MTRTTLQLEVKMELTEEQVERLIEVLEALLGDEDE